MFCRRLRVARGGVVERRTGSETGWTTVSASIARIAGVAQYLFPSGAAQESNLPSVGLQRLTGFEDRLGHRARAAPPARLAANGRGYGRSSAQSRVRKSQKARPA